MTTGRIVFFGLLVLLSTSMALRSPCAQQGHNFAHSQSDVSHEYSSTAPAKEWLRYYKDDGSTVGYKAIMGFISAHPDFPAMSVLRARAEKAMPSSLSDEHVLGWFSKNPPETSFGMKLYADALVRSGQESLARQKINEWWEQARLTSEDQGKGWAYFKSALTTHANVERLRILVHRDQYTNARNLANVMGGSYATLVEARIALRSGKGNADALIARVPSSLQNDEGLLYDRLVYRRKKENNTGAVEILNRSPSSDKMYSPENWGKERGIIARRYFEQGQYAKAYQISANHKIKEGTGFSSNEWMAGWLALEFLNKPWEAFKHFEKMYHGVESPISRSRGAYWAGLASKKMNHPEVAVKWFEVGRKYPTTFYGQLCLEEMGAGPNISSNKPSGGALKSSDLAKAARWLRKNGYKNEAGLFLTKMIDASKTSVDYASVAEVANDISMKNYAIKAAQEAEKKTGVSMVGYSFPRIEKNMSNSSVEWALVHALIRQESRYDDEAVSSAGALGLMQLMPRTAAEVAKKAGMAHQKSWLVTRPAHNVALGSRYIQQLVNRYDGNYAMALAAYNAGPARVSQWVEKFDDPRNVNVNLVNWIESIPIYETRNYVQRVLEGVYVYRKTLSRNQNKASHASTHIAAQ